MIHAITGLRFFVALWVVLFHLVMPLYDYDMGWGRHIALGETAGLVHLGHHGVEVFFVLSGFVMSYAHRRDFAGGVSLRKYIHFIGLRFARVYPLHLTLLLYLVLAVEMGWIERRSPMNDGLIFQLTMTHGWLPASYFGDLTWNMPAWSVSVEWAAYLVFPLVVALLAKIHWTPAKLLFAVGCLVTPYAWWFEGKHLPWHLGEMGLMRVTTGFGLGLIVYEAYRLGWGKRLSWNVVPWLLIYLAVAYTVTPQLQKTTIVLCSALGIFSLAHSDGAVSRLLASRWLVYLGTISYGVYLVHYPLFLTLSRVMPNYFAKVATSDSRLHVYLVAFAVLSVLIAISSILYHVVEKPARNIIRAGFARLVP